MDQSLDSELAQFLGFDPVLERFWTEGLGWVASGWDGLPDGNKGPRALQGRWVYSIS